MTTQYTTILKLALPVTGELSGSWGDVVNNNITSMVEQAVAGLATINTWSANAHTLTTANGVSAESRCAMLVLTDTGAALTGAATVICPANSKIYIVKNTCGQAATIKTASGTGVTIPNGDTSFVFCDGTNVVQAVTRIQGADLDFAKLKGTGAVVVTNILDEDDMASDSATALATQQSIKAYVDAQISANNYLSVVLTNGNTTDGTNLIVSAGDTLTVDTINETTAGNGVVIDGITVGRGAGDVSTNTAVGASALAANTTGASNTAIGESALSTNITNSFNTAVGRNALQDNTANSNTAVGTFAGGNNTTGSSNTFLGSSAGFSQTTATQNTSIGSLAGYAVTTGSNNVLVGQNAGYQFTFDPVNPPNVFTTGITTASGSVVIGQDAGSYANGINTIVGYQSHRRNGVENATLGYQTLGYGYYHFGASTNSYNVAVGHQALRVANGVLNSVAVGHKALYSTTSGDNNVAFGYQAGLNVTTGANNAFFGYVAGTDAVANISTTSNNIVMGNNSHTNAYIKVSWTVTSDARDKTSFAPVPLGLAFVNSLTPTAYQFRVSRDDDTPTGRVRYGFKAQDILIAEGANPVIIDNNDPENLKYNQDSMIAVLVKAIQELKAEFDAYKATHP